MANLRFDSSDYSVLNMALTIYRLYLDLPEGQRPPHFPAPELYMGTEEAAIRATQMQSRAYKAWRRQAGL